MLHVNRGDFNRAVEAMKIAALTVVTLEGLKVGPQIPDDKRTEAVVLGAIVALVNGPVHLADERHISLRDIFGGAQ